MKMRLLAAGIVALALSGCKSSIMSPSVPAPDPKPVVKKVPYEQT